jgi:hypothetical protein
VLTPEQIAMRYGAVAKKTAPNAVLPPELDPRQPPPEDPATETIDFEGLAKRAMNTRIDQGGPPRGQTSAAEREFEKSVLGSAPVQVDDSEYSRYRAGEQRFAEVQQRRMQSEAERLKKK